MGKLTCGEGILLVGIFPAGGGENEQILGCFGGGGGGLNSPSSPLSRKNPMLQTQYHF